MSQVVTQSCVRRHLAPRALELYRARIRAVKVCGQYDSDCYRHLVYHISGLLIFSQLFCGQLCFDHVSPVLSSEVFGPDEVRGRTAGLKDALKEEEAEKMRTKVEVWV